MKVTIDNLARLRNKVLNAYGAPGSMFLDLSELKKVVGGKSNFWIESTELLLHPEDFNFTLAMVLFGILESSRADIKVIPRLNGMLELAGRMGESVDRLREWFVFWSEPKQVSMGIDRVIENNRLDHGELVFVVNKFWMQDMSIISMLLEKCVPGSGARLLVLGGMNTEFSDGFTTIPYGPEKKVVDEWVVKNDSLLPLEFGMNFIMENNGLDKNKMMRYLATNHKRMLKEFLEVNPDYIGKFIGKDTLNEYGVNM